MSSSAPRPIHSQPGTLKRNGLTESVSERMLRDWLLASAAFTGGFTALLLMDEAGIWYRDSSGLSEAQLAALEEAVAQAEPGRLRDQGLQVIEALPLVDVYQHRIGLLCLLSAGPLELPETHREGLRRVAGTLQSILTADRQQREMRTTPRAPSAASFVPGLVHELHNFVFGISANLDAFEARFIDQEEVRKYGTIIRRSLERLSAFIAELGEYGDPQKLAWTERSLEPLIRDVFEYLKPLAERNHVQLVLHGNGTLPVVNLDEASLRTAFIRLISLVMQQGEAGSSVDLWLSTGRQGDRLLISGHIEGDRLKLKELDLARLFEPFYFRESGMGRLALPVARRIFESHGGNLSAGPRLDGGIRISFQLPAAMTYPGKTPGSS